MAACADDRGADGFAAQHIVSPAQAAFPDGLSQHRPQIPEFQPRQLFLDAVRHAAGEGQQRRSLDGDGLIRDKVGNAALPADGAAEDVNEEF